MTQIKTLSNHIDHYISKMDFRNLKKEAIVLGMNFSDVVRGDYCRLSTYIVDNYGEPRHEDLIEQYDDYIEDELRKENPKLSEAFFHKSLRLSYVGEERSKTQTKDIEVGIKQKVKTKKEKIKKESKPSATKNPYGIKNGTKKALVYELSIETDKSINDVIEAVNEQFGSANSKSITIWYKKAKAHK